MWKNEDLKCPECGAPLTPRTDRLVAALCTVAVIFLLALILSSCATIETPRDYWIKDAEPIERIEITEVAAMPWEGVQAYTLRGPHVCQIIIRANVHDRECVLAHERKHCAGWSHPNYPRAIACVEEN